MQQQSVSYQQDSTIVWQQWLLLVLVIFAGFFWGLGSFPLENMNEGLYAEIPREMLATHAYIIPHLNFVPYLEKPPMLYWLIALMYKLFGISEMSARLVPSLAATATCFVVVRASMWLKRSQLGLTAALLLASTVGFILMARIVIFDMVLTAFLTTSILLFYRWVESQNRHHLQWAYVALAGAVLTKGIVAIIITGGIAITYLATLPKPGQRIRQLFDVGGILWFLALTVPWHLVAGLVEPEFFYQYFINEHVLRFLNMRVPNDYHHGPIYFYLPRLAVMMMPWTLCIPALFKRGQWKDPWTRFLWIWFLLPLLFFSLSQAKGDYYAILSMPPFALLIAQQLQRLIQRRSRALLWMFMAIALLVTSCLGLLTMAQSNQWLMSFLPEKLKLQPFIIPLAQTLLITSAIISLAGFIIGWKNNDKPFIHLVLIAFLMMPLAGVYVQDKQLLQEKRSEYAVADFINHHEQGPVYIFQDFENLSTLPFYLQNHVGIIDSKSLDLYYGSHTKSGIGWFVDLPEFAERASRKPVYVVMHHGKVKYFQQKIMPLEFDVIYRSGDTVILYSNINQHA